MAGVQSHVTFVVVGALRPAIRFNRITFFAPALERTQSINAFAVAAFVRKLCAFVDIYNETV